MCSLIYNCHNPYVFLFERQKEKKMNIRTNDATYLKDKKYKVLDMISAMECTYYIEDDHAVRNP